MAEVEVIVTAHINPTESQEKLEKAIVNLFGEVTIQKNGSRGNTRLEVKLRGIESLRKLRESIARDRIRDSTRSIMSRWAAKDSKLSFHLNRQAAYAGHVSIYHASKAPLGPIEVEILGDPAEIVEFLCG